MIFWQRYSLFAKYKRKATLLMSGSLYKGAFISLSDQVLVYHVEAAVRNQRFRNSNAFRSLVVFE